MLSTYLTAEKTSLTYVPSTSFMMYLSSTVGTLPFLSSSLAAEDDGDLLLSLFFPKRGILSQLVGWLVGSSFFLVTKQQNTVMMMMTLIDWKLKNHFLLLAGGMNANYGKRMEPLVTTIFFLFFLPSFFLIFFFPGPQVTFTRDSRTYFYTCPKICTVS